jgi:hypothetical protein
VKHFQEGKSTYRSVNVSSRENFRGLQRFLVCRQAQPRDSKRGWDPSCDIRGVTRRNLRVCESRKAVVAGLGKVGSVRDWDDLFSGSGQSHGRGIRYRNGLLAHSEVEVQNSTISGAPKDFALATLQWENSDSLNHEFVSMREGLWRTHPLSQSRNRIRTKPKAARHQSRDMGRCRFGVPPMSRDTNSS